MTKQWYLSEQANTMQKIAQRKISAF